MTVQSRRQQTALFTTGRGVKFDALMPPDRSSLSAQSRTYPRPLATSMVWQRAAITLTAARKHRSHDGNHNGTYRVVNSAIVAHYGALAFHSLPVRCVIALTLPPLTIASSVF
jgi:hypothetical protein